MVDIKTLSDKELEKDLLDSHEDIEICTFSLLNGITKYSGGSVQKRLDDNKYFVEVITTELNRRKDNERWKS